MSNLPSIDVIAYAVYLIAVAICGVAVWKGDPPLRLAAAVLLVTWTLSALAGRRDVYDMNYPTTVIDTNCALIFVWISLRWRRLWCAVLAALMIVEVTIPLVVFFDRDIHRYNQTLAYNVVTMPLLVVMALATWQAFRARRRIDEATLPA
uniref:hypothetical protein n=1 Tax=uncultured Caulobacter sp. TaxID=158749 RepID=UPI0025E11903|nr:hypothetical protein [uncultured Caulobacter sp.]